MNLIPEIAKMLGVELEEEFEVCHSMDTCIRYAERYKFIDNALICADVSDKSVWGCASCKTLRDIVNGSLTVIKLPFEPKNGDRYFRIFINADRDKDLKVSDDTWVGWTTDYMCKSCGNCFRTKAEAEKHKYEIYEKLTGKKWRVAE